MDHLDLNKRLLALPDNKTDHVPDYLPRVPGMPVFLQENIACELGLSSDTPAIFRNSYYTLVEILKSKTNTFEDLEP